MPTHTHIPIYLDLDHSLAPSFFVLGEDSAIEYEIHSARPSAASSKPPPLPPILTTTEVLPFGVSPSHVAELALFADESRRLSLDLAATRESRRVSIV